eukprot:GHVQ01038005.1.p1 GENE.GHVQ01038005.1~~GHVQ01038005.1.p1  ORF type:complete len:496 (+),score=45.09 GHVQ01038005.1:108-1595(+)
MESPPTMTSQLIQRPYKGCHDQPQLDIKSQIPSTNSNSNPNDTASVSASVRQHHVGSPDEQTDAHCAKCLDSASHLPNPLLSAGCIIGIFLFFLAAGAAHEKLYAVGGFREVPVISHVHLPTEPDVFPTTGPEPSSPSLASAETDSSSSDSDGSNGAALALVEEKFVYSVFLVFIWCVVNCILSFLALVAAYGYTGFKQLIAHTDHVVYKQLGIASCSYVTSLLASNYALTHVNYPTQVLVKSGKTVPIVVGGFVQYRKIYPWYDYLTVFVVTVGLTVFNLEKLFRGGGRTNGGGVNGNGAEGGDGHGIALACGIALLVLALICDGITGPTQDQLLAKRPKLNALVVMLIMNLIAALLSGVAFLIIEHLAAIEFCWKYPSSLYYIGLFALASSLGQFCIFGGLKLMGSLHLAMVTTVRKFCSIVVSILLYNHHVSLVQWICIVCIFGSLAIQTYESNKAKEKIKKRKSHHVRESTAAEQTCTANLASQNTHSKAE